MVSCVLYTLGYIGSHFYKAGRHSQFFFCWKIKFFWTLQLILGLNFEETMICNDFVIELSEDFLVVINQFEELAGYGTKIVLADSKSWWDLKLIVLANRLSSCSIFIPNCLWYSIYLSQNNFLIPRL